MVATALDKDRMTAKRTLSCLRVGCFCLALASVAHAVSAADRVPTPPRITVTPPKPPVVNRPNLPPSRIPTVPPAGAGPGRDAPQVQIPSRRRGRPPLPSESAGIPVRASPKTSEPVAQKAESGKAPTVSGGGGFEGAAVTGGGGLSNLPTAGGGGFDTQALVRTGQ